MYFCDRSTEAFGRQIPVIRITAESPVRYLEQKYPKKLNTNRIHIRWKFVDIWHNVQIIASWIAKFASWSLVVLYSQYLVPWLILTNTVLNIANWGDNTDVITHKTHGQYPIIVVQCPEHLLCSSKGCKGGGKTREVIENGNFQVSNQGGITGNVTKNLSKHVSCFLPGR